LERIKIFHTTTHGINRVFERGLSLEAMKNVVNYHDKKQQQCRGKHKGHVYKFEKTEDSKTLVVIAEIKKTEAWLISGWLK